MFCVANRKIGLGHKPFIIAEVSANHGGSIQRAKDTILAAKRVGADAVKIQTYTPDTMTLDSKKPDFLISAPGTLSRKYGTKKRSEQERNNQKRDNRL